MWSTGELIKISFNWAKQYTSALKVNISNQQVPTIVVSKLGNWIQLNSDRAIKEESGFATIKGVLHNRYNEWVIGYNRCMHICSVLDSELWGILEGLTIVMDRDFNSYEAIQAIKGRATKVQIPLWLEELIFVWLN
ncbi:hypothetical protein PVK06_038251 [Gossypium arboreum]|uniref:Uncharacterized protein n=1 Tax=Gossypium arboreum TaxID=29729 RepID=A0ABR0MZN1_GOSAR|nr:hypothetical protein PVK06_038251 [Gossypium arboreum]